MARCLADIPQGGQCESVRVWYSSGGRGGRGRVGRVETRRVEDGKADGWDDRRGQIQADPAQWAHPFDATFCALKERGRARVSRVEGVAHRSDRTG